MNTPSRSLWTSMIAAALTGLLSLSASAASSTTITTSATTLRIDNTGEPETLDPQRATGMREFRIVRELYEPLITYDAAGKLVPGLAASWETSADGRVWTFHLRRATWSDGTAITADDAVFAFRRALAPATHAQNAYQFYPIVNARDVNTGKKPPEALGVSAIDPLTVQVSLESPLSYMTTVIADVALAPLPHRVIGSLDNTRWVRQRPLVVSGAYQLAQWTPQVDIVLIKNPAYYDAHSVRIERVIFYPIENAATALNRYRSGTLDIMYSQLPSSSYRWAKDHLATALKRYPVLVHYVYLPNMRAGQPLADKRIREAMNLAVERELITGKIIQNDQRPSYAALPAAITQPDPAPQFAFKEWPRSKRLARAIALMKEAGYSPQRPLDITLSLSSGDDHRRIAVALAAMWQPIGIAPHVIIRDSSAHYGAIHCAQFQLARYGFLGTMVTPADELGMYVSTASNNYTGYHNPQYDLKVAEGIHARTPAQARASFDDAQRMLLDDSALVPILDQWQTLLISPKVQGWEPNVMDIHPIRYMTLAP